MAHDSSQIAAPMKFIVIIAASTFAVAIANPTEHGGTTESVGNTLDNASGGGKFCHWDSTASFCAGSCPKGYREARDRSLCGDGACCWTEDKAFCCRIIPI